MSNDRPVISDEKQRVAGIVRELFQTLGRVVRVGNASIALTVDASDVDDAAIFSCDGQFELVVASDYVRGPKFALAEMGLLTPHDLGFFLAVANISDIAAMGAQPIGLLTVVRYPPDLTDEDFRSLMQGIRDGADSCGTVVVGGDIGTAERIVLSGAALGVCAVGRTLRRNGARPGDILCLGGTIGVAGASVLYHASREQRPNLSAEIEEELLRSWKRPTAQVDLGKTLSSTGVASACQDVSDGLLQTLTELGCASEVGLEVDARKLPIPRAVSEVASLFELDAIEVAVSASTDFSLAFTVPPDEMPALDQALRMSGLEATPIGVATEAVGTWLRVRGQVYPMAGAPWRHRSDSVDDVLAELLSHHRKASDEVN